MNTDRKVCQFSHLGRWLVNLETSPTSSAISYPRALKVFSPAQAALLDGQTSRIHPLSTILSKLNGTQQLVPAIESVGFYPRLPPATEDSEKLEKCHRSLYKSYRLCYAFFCQFSNLKFPRLWGGIADLPHIFIQYSCSIAFLVLFFQPGSSMSLTMTSSTMSRPRQWPLYLCLWLEGQIDGWLWSYETWFFFVKPMGLLIANFLFKIMFEVDINSMFETNNRFGVKGFVGSASILELHQVNNMCKSEIIRSIFSMN